jgi:pyrimidine deaminase RibD-like protein
MIYRCKKELVSVNYKTVVSALQQTEPDVLKAVLIPLADSQYELKVKVSLEYLNAIEEGFLFSGEKIA